MVASPSAALAAEQAAEYSIGLGDVLHVQVAGRADLSGKYTVGPDGQIALPLVGAVTARGRATRDLSIDLSRRYSLFDRDITQVTVSIAEVQSRIVFVLGAVLRPGKYSFSQEPSVWDAIGEAGGPADDALLSYVEIIPGAEGDGRRPSVVDVANAVRLGQLSTLPRLKPGDTVRVPRGVPGAPLSYTVSVFGAVAVQGIIPLEQAQDLISALIRSGGPTADANLSRIEIIRKSGPRVVSLKVSVENYLAKASTPGNPPLVAGDTVYVPRSGSGRPGFFAIARGLLPVIAIVTAGVGLVSR